MNLWSLKQVRVGGLSLLALVLFSGWAVPVQASALFGAGGNLYHYDTATQTVTLKQSSIGTIEQLVELDDGTLGIGATTGGGTFYHAVSPDNVNSVATGRGTFEAMTKTADGVAYGTTTNSGSLAWYDSTNASHSVSHTSLGGFSDMTGFAGGSILAGTNGGDTVAEYTSAGATIGASSGWVSMYNAVTYPTTPTVAIFTGAWNNGYAYLWEEGGAQTFMGGNYIQTRGVAPIGNDGMLMVSDWGGGAIEVRQSDAGYPSGQSGWGTMDHVIGLTNGDGLIASDLSGGTLIHFDHAALSATSAATSAGTIVDMISLASGYAIAGNDSGVLYFWDGSSFFTDDNGGSGWGNFEMFVDLDSGDALVGSDLNGGSLLLIDGAVGGFTVSSVDSNLGTFNLGGSVIPEPATMLLLGLGTIGLISRRKRR